MGAITTMPLAYAGNKEPAVTFTSINEVDVITFSTMNSGWLDPMAKFDEEFGKMVKSAQEQNSYTLTDEERNRARQMVAGKPRFKLMSELSTQNNLVIYRLGIFMPDDVQLKLDGRGSLSFELEFPDGQRASITDQGIICPYKSIPIDKWADTRNGLVTFTSAFNQGRPGDWPNTVFVRLPRSVLGFRVTKVTLTDRAEIVMPKRTVVYK